MNSRIPYRARMFAFAVVFALGLSLMGCKADQLSGLGAEIVLLYDEPLGCENLGEVDRSRRRADGRLLQAIHQ